MVVTAPDNTVLVTEIKCEKSDADNGASAGSGGAAAPAAAGISFKDSRKLDSRIGAAFSRIIENDYPLPYVKSRNPFHAAAAGTARGSEAVPQKSSCKKNPREFLYENEYEIAVSDTYPSPRRQYRKNFDRIVLRAGFPANSFHRQPYPDT
jgi:hypothetical protein